jgi:hypothetical protein
VGHQTTTPGRIVAGGALVLLGVLASVAFLLRDPLPHFCARRSALARATLGTRTTDRGYELQQVRINATSGLAVELTVRRAASDTGRLPVALILGGHYQGRDAVKLLGDTRGVLVAVMSYPFAGDPRPDALTFLREIPSIRAAFLDTPPALMLSLDYLLTRADVDPTRVEAVGVSLGAPFVVIAGALDTRITRVWALHGSGGSFAPLEMNMRRSIHFAPVRYPAAALANVIVAGPRLAPERWVSRIAARPFVMVNALGDERLSRARRSRHCIAPRRSRRSWCGCPGSTFTATRRRSAGSRRSSSRECVECPDNGQEVRARLSTSTDV